MVENRYHRVFWKSLCFAIVLIPIYIAFIVFVNLVIFLGALIGRKVLKYKQTQSEETHYKKTHNEENYQMAA